MIDDDLPEHRQTSVKKMPGIRYDNQLRPGFELIDPVDDCFAVHDIIRIALHDQPRAFGLTPFQ